MKNLIFILFIFLAGCGESRPTPTASPNPTPTVPQATPTETVLPTVLPTFTEAPQIGLGISQDIGANLFQLLKFSFILRTDASGNDVYVGTLPDKFAEVQLFGPTNNLKQAVLVMWVPQPPSKAQTARMETYLGTMLTVFASNWSEGSDWLITNSNKIGETKTQFGEDEAILDLTPSKKLMTVELTIRVAQRR